MRHERRWVVGAAVILLLGATLAGCGGSTTPPPASAPPPGPGGSAPPSAGPGVTGPAAPGATAPADVRPTQPPPAGQLTTGWRYRFDMVSPANERNAIRERAVDLYFWPDTTRIWFQMENRLGRPIKILWNEFRYRDTDGRTFKVVHEGTSYERRNDTLDYTLVPGNERYSDWFVPVDLLEDPRAAQGGSMRLLFPTDAMAESYISKTFGATFVLEVDGLPREYDLVFKVQSVIPPQ